MPYDSQILQIAKRIVKEHPEDFDAFLEFEKTGKLPKIIQKKN